MIKIMKFLCLVLFAAAAAFAVQGGASEEATGAPIRGEGKAEISGYAVADLHFRLAEDPTLIQEMTPYLQRYPGISPSNAFFLHQIDGLKAQIQAAKDEGIKEGEARAQQAFKTNRGMTTVTGGRRTPAPAADPNRSIEDAEEDMLDTLRTMRGGSL